MFVLNLECPADEVDITSEPDKTWVEFSHWPTARNACLAMLLVSSCRKWGSLQQRFLRTRLRARLNHGR